jgi:hypothetical protein
MNFQELLDKAKNIEQVVLTTFKDKGCSVIGGSISISGIVFSEQIHQSEVLNQRYFQLVKDMLIDNGISRDIITINYGQID